jgi:hypothetical protein
VGVATFALIDHFQHGTAQGLGAANGIVARDGLNGRSD